MSDAVHLPSDEELAAALNELRVIVEANALLKSAKLSDSFLKRVLWAKHCKIQNSEKLLLAYADWHLKHLGAADARLSITAVHAFLLTGVLQEPPGARDLNNRLAVYMQPDMYKPGKIPA
eukprot:gene27473-4779_t